MQQNVLFFMLINNLFILDELYIIVYQQLKKEGYYKLYGYYSFISDLLRCCIFFNDNYLKSI
jgi:hypothetical protein